MMTKKMSLLLTGMLLCLAPDIKVQYRRTEEGGIYSYLFLYRLRGNF